MNSKVFLSSLISFNSTLLSSNSDVINDVSTLFFLNSI